MLTGVYAARNIVGGQHDVWTVNTETAYHEEGQHPDAQAGDRSVPVRKVSSPGPAVSIVLKRRRPCPSAGLATFQAIRLAVVSPLAVISPGPGCIERASPVFPAAGGRARTRLSWLAAMKMERIMGR